MNKIIQPFFTIIVEIRKLLFWLNLKMAMKENWVYHSNNFWKLFMVQIQISFKKWLNFLIYKCIVISNIILLLWLIILEVLLISQLQSLVSMNIKVITWCFKLIPFMIMFRFVNIKQIRLKLHLIFHCMKLKIKYYLVVNKYQLSMRVINKIKRKL